MKIYIQLMSSYAPSWGFGGPIRLMLDYAKWMKLTFSVYVFAGNIKDDYTAYDKTTVLIDGVKIDRYKVFFIPAAKRNFNILSFRMLIDVYKTVSRAKEGVVLHICELRGLVTIYALLVKLTFSSRVKLVHSAFGMLHEKNSMIRTIFDFLFLKRLLSNIDIELVQNRHEEIEYINLASKYNVKVSNVLLLPLHTSITHDCNRYVIKRRSEIYKLREKYGVPLDSTVFIFLGRFCAEKGLLRTISAFLEFKSRNKKSFLIIAGKDFNYRVNIEEELLKLNLNEAVKIVENVNTERFEYYLLSDIFLGFPIIYEETMLASVEALSCGTPIVVSKEADIPFVEESGAGFVIDYSSESAVCAMEKIANNLQYYQNNAYGVALKHFRDIEQSKILSVALS